MIPLKLVIWSCKWRTWKQVFVLHKYQFCLYGKLGTYTSKLPKLVSCLFTWVMKQINAITYKYAAAPMTRFKTGMQLLMYHVQYSMFTSFLLLDVGILWYYQYCFILWQLNWFWYKGTSVFVYMAIKKNLLDQSECSKYLEILYISLCMFMFSRNLSILHLKLPQPL